MEKAVENQPARARGKAATGKVSEKAVKELGEKWSMKPARTVGAGLPVAPVPGYWVTTVNAWRVQIRGEYPRFARAPMWEHPINALRTSGARAM